MKERTKKFCNLDVLSGRKMKLSRTTFCRQQNWMVIVLYYMLILLTVGFAEELKKPPDDFCPTPCVCTRSTGVVNCSSRSVREIPTDIPSWVTRLYLRNSKISQTGLSSYDFSSLTQLQELDLSENKIQNFTVDLTRTYSLRKIALNHCSLSALPEIRTPSNITHLYLSHNSITELDRLNQLPELVVLDLSYNKIKQLGIDSFLHQTKLTHLLLQKNRVAVLEWNAFAGLDSVDTIDLSRNRIKNIVKPKTSQPSKQERCFGNLVNLKHINLSQNLISHIDGLTISGMCELETLRLDRNRISRLSDGAFYGPLKLKSLYLDHNHINAVSRGWLFELSSLETLSASFNNISVIQEDGWSFCKELIHLNLSHNFLPRLSAFGFSQLSKLQTLYLGHNKVKVLEDEAFQGLSQLRILDISFNEISARIDDIKGAFLGLSSIEHLSLRRNRIRTLSASVLEGIENVATLDLRENNVSSIQNRTFENMPNLRQLQLTSESFICDCQLSWFPLWLASANKTREDFQYNVRGTCFHPPSLKGRTLMSVEQSEFVCGMSDIMGSACLLYQTDTDIIGDHPVPVIVEEPKSQTALRGQNVTFHCGATATYLESDNATTPTPPPTPGNPLPNAEIPKPSGESRAGTNPSRDSFLSLKADTSERVEEKKEEMTILWKRGQDIIYDGDGVHIRNTIRREAGRIYTNTELVLTGVTSADDGYYNCIISNEYGDVRSELADLKVNEHPKFTKIPVNVTVVRNGSSAILECAATGEPAPQITWQKDGGKEFPAATDRRLLREQEEIHKVIEEDEEPETPKNTGMKNPLMGGTVEDVSDSQGIFMVDTDAPLHIGVVLPEDAGEYECVVQSSVGKIVAKALLIVEIPPTFAKPMEEVSQAVMGGNAVIQCMSDANPPPHISWHFNGYKLNHTSRHFMAAEGQVLVIVDTRMTDVGLYTCTVWNKLGKLNGTTELKVLESASDFQDEGGFFRMFDGNTTTGIIVIVVFICVVFTSLVWLIILCYARRNPEQALSTNTEETNDVHSCGSTDESIRKCQSYNSIHMIESEANGVNVAKLSGKYDACHYHGSASTSDVRLMQIQRYETPMQNLRPGPRDPNSRIYRCQSSSAIKKDPPLISRFRSAENFQMDDRHVTQIPKDRNNFLPRRPSKTDGPIVSPSSYFARKAANEDNYVPVVLKKQGKEQTDAAKPPESSSSTTGRENSRSRAKKLKKVKVHNQRKLMQQGNEQSESDSAMSSDHRTVRGCGEPQPTHVGDRGQRGVMNHNPPRQFHTHGPLPNGPRQCDKTDNLSKSQSCDSAKQGNAESWRGYMTSAKSPNHESWRSYHYPDWQKGDQNASDTSSGVQVTRSPVRGSRTDSDISSGSICEANRPKDSTAAKPADFSSVDTIASEASTLLSSEHNSVKFRHGSAILSKGPESERLLTSVS